MLMECDRLQSHAVQEIMEIVSLGMQCKVLLRGVFGSHLLRGSQGETVSLLSIDPYPHHVATALSFVADYLFEGFQRDSIKKETLDRILRIIMDALNQVPQCSLSLQSLLDNVSDRLRMVVDSHSEMGADFMKHFTELVQGGSLRGASNGTGTIDVTDSPANAAPEADTADATVSNTPPHLGSIQELSVALFVQWDWSLFAESSLGFEDHEDSMFLSEHGLLEVCDKINADANS